AAAVVVMSAEKATRLNLHPLGVFRSFATAGVPPEIMGIGPVDAVPKAVRLAGLSLSEINLIELNEAFAAQTLAVMRQLDLDPETVNVNGGAIALGHPLGCTGAKLTATLLYEMRRRNARYGLVTLCVGGGMGAPEAFTDEHRLIAQTARDFAEREIIPNLDRIEQKDWALTRQLFRRLGELGFLGAGVPTAYGGSELDMITSLIVAEELAVGSFS